MYCNQRNLKRRYVITTALVFVTMGALSLTGCGSGHSSSTAKFNRTQAESLLSSYAAQSKAKGISAAIVQGSSLLWSQGTGTANTALNTKATDETVFLVASISKTVTAVAVMQLVEAGKLDLDRDINDYLDFKLTNPKHPEAIITLRHLLTHTSGIVDDYLAQVATPALYYKDIDPTLSLGDLCRAFFTTTGQYYDPASFTTGAPGTQYSYCNIAIALTGYIVERAAGQSFADYCKQCIFSPLDMKKTSWRVADFTTQQMAMPYDGEGQPLGNYTFADYPDGALRTTVKDLSRFLRAFIQNGTLDGKIILKASSVEEMRRIQFPAVAGAERQGLAWEGTTVKGISLLGHTGAEQGTTTAMYFDPTTKVGAIYFQNRLADSEEEQGALIELFGNLIIVGEDSVK